MDIAYDHIQEEVLSPDEIAKKEAEDSKRKQPTLNNEFQEAYKSFSASPWGAKLGGFFSDVKKQGESYYKEAQQEASAAGEEALKGFTGLRSTLVNRARSMSAAQQEKPSDDPQTEALDKLSQPPVTESAKEKERKRTESEALRESEGLIARFRSEATKRLKEVQKAEDAADEALLKFGTNVRNFLRDAVTIAPPSEGDDNGKRKDVLFESKDQDGQRVIHTTRFDAQLHAIHSSSDSFLKDPESAEYEKWQKEFDVEKKTDAIAADLEKYEGLRKAMEKLVPEKVDYKTFWSRYYFLRMVIETEEQRRREMLKGATLDPEEPISWDDDSDSDTPSTPQPSASADASKPPNTISSTSHSSTTTILPPAATTTTEGTKPLETNSDSLRPTNGSRRSQDQHSQPDSDASYDLVSGATSRAPGSPKDERGPEMKDGKKVESDDDEPDWE
ncbi:MAG: hypothetical protein LQ350_006550 [Teloschistes chrysophthalmus]|nr:MAG: hypothetical protein LQ350_006550 [Niorma chrysophthalma]